MKQNPKKRYLKLLDFITIDIIKTEQQSPEQDIITFTMDQIINISFRKHPISWERIFHHILYPYDSVIKGMFHHQTLTGIPKHCHKYINESPCILLFISKMKISLEAQIFKP